MKAIVYHRYGEPEVLKLGELPDPIVKPDCILVRVMAASVNPADWQIRSGKRNRLSEPFCYIPGIDFSGVVERVGESVDCLQPGMSVFGMAPLALDTEGRGSYAELVAVSAASASPMPDGMSYEEAAALPVAVLTAWNALFTVGGLSAGQTALIHAAAGGVGHIAVQLAKSAGAHVVGTASGRNQIFLRKIGVDEPVNYETERFEDVIEEADLVLDTVVCDAQLEIDNQSQDIRFRSWRVLKRGGILVSITETPEAAMAEEYCVRSAYAMAENCPQALLHAAALFQAGKLKPYISAEFPLEQAAKGQAYSQTGHTRGKIILRIGL